ncbi:hypothetical protein PLESTF_001118000 [Pleodorina starrii]|nr:hypothetical protein PLESTF_001118000 [Pleodorina starrii]
MIYSIAAALDVVGNNAGADNYFVLSQSVVATSILFLIYACVIFGLCLWRALLEAEIDHLGEVKDKLQLYQMANLGVRICWLIIMTWLVLLLSGCGIFGVYVSNMRYLVRTTLENQNTVGAPVRTGAYPDCPATCVDLYVVDYIDVPLSQACVCSPSALKSILGHLNNAVAGAPGCFVGAFMMYVVAGFWRSELSKHHAFVMKEQDVAARLSGGEAPVAKGGLVEMGLRRGPAGGANGYRPLAGGPGGGGRGGGRGGAGRGRGRGEEG